MVIKCISCIGLFPPESIIELKDRQVGIIISTNYHYRHLPKILLLRDEHKMPQPKKVINLEHAANSYHHQHLIKTVIPNSSHDFRIKQYIQKGLTIE